MVITDLIARYRLRIGLFAIDTGMLHAETLAMITALEDRYALAVRLIRPDPEAVAELVGRQGAYAFYDSIEARQACCHVRKVVPLARALEGHAGWVTGQRRDAAASRAQLAEVETDPVRGIAKFNPLADWSFEDVMAYCAAHDVPVSPLYARGYRSIGCEPCTRALKPGEDIRAGRWWWEQGGASKECGLHVSEAAQ
jgi:phosphoadenosine phosphosulfate reductase